MKLVPLEFTELPDLKNESNQSLIGLHAQAVAQDCLFDDKRWMEREHILFDEIMRRMSESQVVKNSLGTATDCCPSANKVSGQQEGTDAQLPACPSATADGLLPCPFCGGKADTQWIPHNMAIPQTVGGYAVICETCFCVQLIGAKTEPEALKNWNKRHGNAL